MSVLSFDTALEALPFPGLCLDFMGSIVHANPSVRQFIAGRPAELNGRFFFKQFPFDEDVTEHEARFLKDVTPGLAPYFFVAALKPTGDDEPVRVKVHVTYLRDGSRPLGLVVLEPLSGSEDLQRQIQDLAARLDTVNAIRHEINNLLMGLMGQAELLQGSPVLDVDGHAKLEQILGQSRLVQARVKEMGAVTRNEPLPSETTDSID